MTDEKLKEFARQAQTTINGSYADKSLYYQGLKSGYEQAEKECPSDSLLEKIINIYRPMADFYDGKYAIEYIKEHWND